MSKRTNEKLWKSIVEKLKKSSKYGGVGWNARKAQAAVKEYKKRGGKYTGRKSSQNSLAKWTKQDWGYVSKRGGRYLPKKVRESLTSSQKAAANRAKKKATKKGKKRAPYTKAVKKKMRKL
jgi:hypothetical protein